MKIEAKEQWILRLQLYLAIDKLTEEDMALIDTWNAMGLSVEGAADKYFKLLGLRGKS